MKGKLLSTEKKEKIITNMKTLYDKLLVQFDNCRQCVIQAEKYYIYGEQLSINKIEYKSNRQKIINADFVLIFILNLQEL